MTISADESPTAEPGLLQRLIAIAAEMDAGETETLPECLDWESECLELLDRAGADGNDPDFNRFLPATIGRYEILRELGRGGFGVVYLARDPKLGREVALKVPLPGMAHSPDVRRRFTLEALAVAGLDHPNIVPVHDARTVGPVAYIASAYCPGPSLASWLKARTEPVPPRLAARLAQALARGVEHAHSRNILHRDLKPANVMLQPGGDHELDGMTPRLTDFGLAKLADGSGADQTRTGLMIGSAPYMAPEQIVAHPGEVGPATDVHALGATLYEILVGRSPYAGHSQHATWNQVLTADPVPPQLLRRDIPRDLQTICLHALRKHPAHRYPTAAAFEADLERFLTDRPILARPASPAERTWRWARKHPAAATSAVALALLIALTGLGMAWSNARLRGVNDQLLHQVDRANQQSREVDRQRRLVADREAVTDRHLHAARLNLARQAIEVGQPERAQAILTDASAAAGSHRRDFAWRYLWRQSRRDLEVWGRHESLIRRIALSPDGTTLASCDAGGRVHLWEVATGTLKATFGDPTGTAEHLAFTPDGAQIALAGFVASNDGPVPRVVLHEVASGRALGRLDFPGCNRVDRVFFTDHGQILVAVVADRADVRTIRGWPLVSLGDLAAPPAPLFAVENSIMAVPTPDRRSFWTHDLDRRTHQRDGKTGRVLRTLEINPVPVEALALSRDGRFLALAAHPARVLLWDLNQGRGSPREVASGPVCPDELQFTADASSLLVIAGGYQARLVRLADGTARDIMPFDPGRRGRLFFALSPDGQWVVSTGEFHPGGIQPVTLWNVATGRVEKIFKGRRKLEHAVFDAAGQSVLLGNDYDVTVWHPFRPTTERFEPFDDHQDEVWSLDFSPDGAALASGGDDARIRFWDPRTGARGRVVSGHEGTVSSLAWHPRGDRIASASLDPTNNLKLWDVPSGDLIATLSGHTDKVRAIAFSPDGTVLASGGTDRAVRIWDGITGEPLGVLVGHTDLIRGLAFARNSRTLVSVGNDNAVRVWDWSKRTLTATLQDRYKLSAVAYSPDGTILASADEGGIIHLRDTSTWQVLRVIRSDDKEIRTLAFSPDGQTLVSAGMSRTIRLWDPATGQALMELNEATTSQINAVTFSPDGSLLLAADHGGRVLIYQGPP